MTTAPLFLFTVGVGVTMICAFISLVIAIEPPYRLRPSARRRAFWKAQAAPAAGLLCGALSMATGVWLGGGW